MTFYVRIARDAGAAAAPEIKLVLQAQSAVKGDAPSVVLEATDKGKSTSLGSFAARTEEGESGRLTAILESGAPSLAFIEGIRNASALGFAAAGTKGTLDLKGLSATLRWIDAQQGRAGTPTALVARGMTPIGQVPEPRRPPVVKAAPAGSASEIKSPVLSKAVRAAVAGLADCDKRTTQSKENGAAWRLAPDTILVAAPCAQYAYNESTAFYLTDANGERARPLVLPRAHPPVGDVAPNILINADFAPATMTLSNFSKGRGIGDCGSTNEWVWTGRTFALVDAFEMDKCAGVSPEDWPNVYKAEKR